MDAPPYTSLLLEVIQKLQNSSSTPNRTSPRGTGAANFPAVRVCAAVLPTHALRCSNGRTPLKTAIALDNSDVVAFLRSAGAPE